MPAGLPYEDWLRRVSAIVEAAYNGRYGLSNIAPDEKWRNCYGELMSPLDAFISLTPSLSAQQAQRAREAYMTIVKNTVPDYMEITRSIAGG